MRSSPQKTYYTELRGIGEELREDETRLNKRIDETNEVLAAGFSV